jgi:ribosome-associated protein YbcJ (S4-like RNA binding protein)
MNYSVKVNDKDETNRSIEFRINDYTDDIEVVFSLDNDKFLMEMSNYEAVKLQEFLKNYL